jgi:hypothetical protein
MWFVLFLLVALSIWLIAVTFWLCVIVAPWLLLRATAFWIPIHWWFVAMLVLGICLFIRGSIDWHTWRSGHK